jgi:two-component system, LytTR family, sensor kinase
VRSTRLRQALTIFGIWTAVGVFSTTQALIASRVRGGTTPWVSFAVGNLLSVWLWALYTPVILWLGRRWRITRARWRRTVPMHLLAALALLLLESALTVVWRHVSFSFDLTARAFLDGVSYAAVLVVAYAADERRVSERRRIRSARLAQQLTEARLGALRTQLRPHFLFNTLHAATALLHRDPDAADAMLTRLATLLRRVFDRSYSRCHEIPLRDELELLDAYVGIIRARFGNRIDVTVQAPSEMLDAHVPMLILQPLVENAVRHGIEPRAGRGSIRVNVRERSSGIQLVVADDGRGMPRGGVWREGVGLRNTRRRLRAMYGQEGTLQILDADPGVMVIVTLPRAV